MGIVIPIWKKRIEVEILQGIHPGSHSWELVRLELWFCHHFTMALLKEACPMGEINPDDYFYGIIRL